jgi:hypothetical protein
MTNRDHLLYTESVLCNGKPRVKWSYNGKSGFLTPTQARHQGFILLTAAIICSDESRLFRNLMAIKPLDNDFHDYETGLMQVLLANRPALSEQIRLTVDYHGDNSRVLCDFYGTTLNLDINDTVSQAGVLHRSAESAETDGYFNSSIEHVGLDLELRERVLMGFKAYRKKQEALDEAF